MRKTFLFALLVILLLPITGEVQPAQGQFMFLNELAPGMEGVGKTVVGGDKIATFNVRIIDIVDNPGELDDHILIRASGEAIARSGGIAAGMSGSPIYVDGKLIGAIWGAATFDVSDEPIALVRPIGTMLELLEPLRERLSVQSSGSVGELVPNRSIAAGPVVDGIEFQRVSTPVWVSGLNGRSLAQLREGLDRQLLAENRMALLPLSNMGGNFLNELALGWERRFDLTFYDIGVQNLAAGGSQTLGKSKPEPGSAVGAMLATGDVSIGSFGTLTYREGDLLLSFGHPFLLRGATEMFLTSIKVLDTVQSLEMPFKFGVPDRRLGAVLEDRFQGIAGALGVDPKSVALKITVRDRAREVKRDFDVDLVDDPDLLPALLYAVILNSIDTTLNRIGPGTLKVDYAFRGAGLVERVERQDIFYSFSDIATSAPLQIAQVGYLLAWNEFTDPGLDRVDVELSVEPEVQVYEILELKMDKDAYRPGDELNWTVTVKPFRGEKKAIQGSLKIPEDVDEGSLTLHAFGGPRPSEDNKEQPKFESLEELTAAIEGLESNDQLTVELLGVSAGEEDEGRLASTEKLKDWVVVGEEFKQIEIEQEEQPEEQPQQEQEEQEKCKQLFYCG